MNILCKDSLLLTVENFETARRRGVDWKDEATALRK